MTTSKEAFEQTMRGFVFVSGEDSAYKLWQAACAYQKQKDAEICKNYPNLHYTILNQGDE